MTPNQALAVAREISHDIARFATATNLMELPTKALELSVAFKSLDDTLKAGGPLPDEWAVQQAGAPEEDVT